MHLLTPALVQVTKEGSCVPVSSLCYADRAVTSYLRCALKQSASVSLWLHLAKWKKLLSLVKNLPWRHSGKHLRVSLLLLRVWSCDCQVEVLLALLGV